MKKNEIRKTETVALAVADMTPEELALYQEQIFIRKQQILEERMKELENNRKKDRTDIDNVINTQEQLGSDIENLKHETNILCAPTHKKRKADFSKKASARVNFLLGNPTTPEYILFSKYFYKGIYSDIAYQLKLSSWQDIPMDNYEYKDSIYTRAIRIRDEWRPNILYFERCLKELIEKRDVGYLPAEKCRALTDFLKSTNNGTQVNFL